LNNQTSLDVVPDGLSGPGIEITTADVTSATLGINIDDLSSPLFASFALQTLEFLLGPGSVGPSGTASTLPAYIRQAEQQFEQF
ncbi:MAG: hypothetical protein AAFZ65_05285, partial [Planctomycetota bacterium]